MRMKCLRIFPETMPRISWPEPSSLSLNIAFGNAVVTVASTSIASDFATGHFSAELSDGGNGTRHGSCKPLGEQAEAGDRTRNRRFGTLRDFRYRVSRILR